LKILEVGSRALASLLITIVDPRFKTAV